MADLPSSPGEACAPAPLHVFITTRMQALYASRGMWANGAPQGVLAGMLGPLVPYLSNRDRQAFYVTAEQLAALWRDFIALPPAAVGLHQRAQFLRRLREAGWSVGLDMHTLQTTPGAPAPTGAARPFHPLRCPADRKARALFQDHVMRTLRDFVDHTQTSSYLKGEDA